MFAFGDALYTQSKHKGEYEDLTRFEKKVPKGPKGKVRLKPSERSTFERLRSSQQPGVK